MLGKKNNCRPVPTLSHCLSHTLYTRSSAFSALHFNPDFLVFFFLFFSDFFLIFLSLLLILTSLLERRKKPIDKPRGNKPSSSPLPVAVQCSSCDNHDLQTFPAFHFPLQESHFGLEVPFSSLLRSLSRALSLSLSLSLGSRNQSDRSGGTIGFFGHPS